ncbi:MAG: hypothetical protein M1150_01145 [Patescibacteria group bacterium]|nr:hypothetical protein [Patescibacteria group bacterium]
MAFRRYDEMDVDLALKNSGANNWRELLEYLNNRARVGFRTTDEEIEEMATDVGKLYASGEPFPYNDSHALYESMRSV